MAQRGHPFLPQRVSASREDHTDIDVDERSKGGSVRPQEQKSPRGKAQQDDGVEALPLRIPRFMLERLDLESTSGAKGSDEGVDRDRAGGDLSALR